MESPENGTEWSPVGGGVVGFIHHLSSSVGLYFFPLFSPRCHTPMRAHPGALIFATQTSAAAKESQSIAGRINDSKCSPSADLKVTPKFFCRQGSAESARETSVSTVHSPLQWHSEVAHIRNWRAGGRRRKAQTLTAWNQRRNICQVATWPGKTGKVKTDQVQLWWPRWILFIVNKNTPMRSFSLYIKVSSAWGQRRNLMETLVTIYSHWDDKVMMITQRAINVSRGSAPTALQWKIWCQLEGKLTFFFYR